MEHMCVTRNSFYAEWDSQNWNDDFADVMVLLETYVDLVSKRRNRMQQERDREPEPDEPTP